MENEQVVEEQTHKKGRHRKKQLYNSILKQMEFYFSDSNLTKDRFLSQLMQNDPYVDVSVFLKFNKIRKLTTNIDDITKAVSKSELIELSDDKSKVQRKLPIKINENVDECTIYVERLKSDATHDWLTNIFSEFGKVVYVSIPKYKHNGMIKGFAFIEFENEEGANTALQYFESIDCKIPSCMEPQNLCSISTFEGDQAIKKADLKEDNKSRKRKISETQEDVKKKNAETQENVVEHKKKKVKSNDETDTKHLNQETSENEAEEKKKRKLEKVHKKKMKEMGLQILSKKEWKKMRNRYLDMQKKTMKELKKHLNRQKFTNRFETNKQNHQETNVDESKTTQDITPGIICKVNLPEPCADNKKLKEEIRTNFQNVKFIDIPIPVNAEIIYIRFAEAKDAESFCSSNFKGKSSILNGNEEKEYWKKIEAQRSAKLMKRSSTKHRGRDKLLKKAEQQAAKHIHFDDDN